MFKSLFVAVFFFHENLENLVKSFIYFLKGSAEMTQNEKYIAQSLRAHFFKGILV